MAGQVAYHLLAQAGVARAPWAITTIVSCLPVLVLGMGTTLAHMLHADAAATDPPASRTAGPADVWSPPRSCKDQPGLDRAQAGDQPAPTTSGPPYHPKMSPADRLAAVGRPGPVPKLPRPEIDQARVIARRLAAAGKPASRRALRSGGIRGSNEALNALARKVNAELATAEAPLVRA